MKKQQVLSRGKRKFWLFARRICMVAAAAAFVVLSCNSTIEVETSSGTFRQSIGPFSKKDTFEDSALFCDILKEELKGITRLAVIKSQLETEGAYNGQKSIDVTKYAHRQEEFLDETVEVPYVLDDLVKWGNYGFVTETVYGTENDFNAYFSSGGSVFTLRNELAEAGGEEQKGAGSRIGRQTGDMGRNTLSIRMIDELPSSREEYAQWAQEMGLYTGDAEVFELHVLIPRYLSAEGLDLASYAQNVEEYIHLREDLKTASKALFYNSTEYWASRNAYALPQSNIRYCYRMVVDGQTRYYTNLEENFSDKKPEEISGIFEQYGRYIAYNADRFEIRTNTRVDADWMKQELGSYQYAFGDNTRVWIGVDTNYPARDSLALVQEAYNRVIPFYGYLVASMLVLLLAGMLLFAKLTRYEGRVAKEGGGYRIALYRADRMHTEPFVVLGALVLAAIVGAGYLGYVFLESSFEDLKQGIWPPVLGAGLTLVLDYVAMALYLSLVRRAKAHTLWSNSLLRLVLVKCRAAVVTLYDHSHILTRSLVPFIGIVLVNLILGDYGIGGILAAAAVDVAAILLLYYEKKALWKIVESTRKIGRGDFALKIQTDNLHGENRELANAVNGLGDGIKAAVEKSMKDERLKADLITNVSHDIKTPLTSIINFVNLLKREKIEDARIRGYIDVLDAKSQRLKQLTDDLVEASKITSGNVSLQMERLNFAELVYQTCGEFSDKFQEKCLETVITVPEGPVYIEADSRRIWRVVENLFSNAYKYALEGTRVYLDIRQVTEGKTRYAVFSMKNISAQALNIDAAELTERFIRGDISRSTEGSGLGLSIAKNLTELQNGRFEIYLDGDLFKVLVTFPCLEEGKA